MSVKFINFCLNKWRFIFKPHRSYSSIWTLFILKGINHVGLLILLLDAQRFLIMVNLILGASYQYLATHHLIMIISAIFFNKVSAYQSELLSVVLFFFF